MMISKSYFMHMLCSNDTNSLVHVTPPVEIRICRRE